MTKKRNRGGRFPVRRVVLCLALGAVVNVLVAWGIVWRSQLAQGREYNAANFSALQHRSSFQLGRYPIVIPEVTPKNHQLWLNVYDSFLYVDGVGYSQIERRVSDGLVSHSKVLYTGTRAGWPLPCLRADRTREGELGENDFSIQRGVRGEDFAVWVRERAIAKSGSVFTPEPDPWLIWSPAGDFQYRIVPLMPMPLGFAVNTLFYATPFLLLFIGVPALRRRKRRRRGLCAWCAYDRAGMSVEQACPECGGRV